jgi:hypothetical protein
MDWQTVVGLAALAFIVVLALLRVERRALWVVIVFMLLPGIVLVGGWAVLYSRWAELLAGLALAAAITGVWWLAGGRRLARPSSDSIKVWGQEKVPKPTPQEAAALRAEVLRLKDDKEKLEAELRRLKDGPPRGNGTPPE